MAVESKRGRVMAWIDIMTTMATVTTPGIPVIPKLALESTGIPDNLFL